MITNRCIFTIIFMTILCTNLDKRSKTVALYIFIRVILGKILLQYCFGWGPLTHDKHIKVIYTGPMLRR